MFYPLFSSLSEILDGEFMWHIHAKPDAAIRCANPLKHLSLGKFTDLLHRKSPTAGNIVPESSVSITREERKWHKETPYPILA